MGEANVEEIEECGKRGNFVITKQFWVEVGGVNVIKHKFTVILVNFKNIWRRICKKETDCISSASNKSYVWF